MPSMANITVKDAANADVTYVGAVPSAGDKIPAIWRANALSSQIALRPTFSVVTRDNQRQNGRVLEASFRFPIWDTVSGVPTLLATVPFTLTGTLPTNVDSAAVADAFTQLGNLIASTLIRTVASEGYAPT